MTSRRFFAFILMLFLFLAENTAHYIFPGIAFPFLLTGVIFYALTDGPAFGVVLGCFAGFLLDILGIGKLGNSMLLFSLIGVFAGLSSSKVFYDSFFCQMVLPAISQYLYFLVNIFIVKSFSPGETLSLAVIQEAFFLSQPWFTIPAAFFIFSLLKKMAAPRHSRSLAPRYY